MIVEATSTDEVATKLDALPLVRAGFLQPPMIVPLKPYFGLRSPLLNREARHESRRSQRRPWSE